MSTISSQRHGGGVDAAWNLRVVHERCNTEKGHMSLADFWSWKDSGLTRRDWIAAHNGEGGWKW